MAVIYNLVPLYKKGITGAGQKVVFVGESALPLDDLRGFRDAAGLPPNEPKSILAAGSEGPGLNDAVVEAILDVDYVGGAAPAATIVYVYHTDVIQAALYAIDQNFAPVISHSWGGCEKFNLNAGAFLRSMAQQAVAEGITWVASTGDSGAA